MKGLILVLLFLAPWSTARAAELLMVEQPGCSWCRRWHEEVGPGYLKSAEGRLAPLRRSQLGERIPGTTLKQSVTVTPTFIVIENGAEVGRITGYPGPDFFYGLLTPILGRLQETREFEAKRQ